MMTIVWIDMQIRDERVLIWIRERGADGYTRITQEEICAEFRCARNTARAILHRLEAARLIEVTRGTKKLGYQYRVCNA